MKQQIIREKRRRRLEKYKQQTNSNTSAMSHSKQNDDEYNESEEGIEIHVVENIPLLNVFLATTTPSIMLYDGELLNTTIKMQNVGSLAVDFIECDFVNKTRSELTILSDANSFCPLMPHEPGVDLPLAIRARWNGNDETAEVILNVRYGNKSKKWFRRISMPLKLTVTQGLVLEAVSAINEQYGREIVCKIRNMATAPFVLLSNDDHIVEIQIPNNDTAGDVLQVEELDWHQEGDRHNDSKQFDKGIPFAPGAIKLILIGPHILHSREESAAEFIITDRDNQFLEGGDPHRDKVHIPYTADPNEYIQFLASRLRWKSVSMLNYCRLILFKYVNTSGTVGCGFVEPLHLVVPELASERKQLKEAREERERRKMEREKEEIDIDTVLSVQTIGSEQPCTARNTSRLATRNRGDQNSMMTQQVALSDPVSAKLGEKITTTVTLSHDRKKALNSARMVITVYQDSGEESKLTATPSQFAFSGKLVNALDEYVEEGDLKIYTLNLQLFFLESGAYKIVVECVRVGTEQKLAPPLQMKIIAS